MTPSAERPPGLELLHHFCRMQLPSVNVSPANSEKHLRRTFDLFRTKINPSATWQTYLENLYPVDWFLAAACLEGDEHGWEQLFAARAGRTDCLLLDALRARAARLYPRDEERQESAVTEFWSQLFVPENEASLPILARYDGQRPLVPWLIRVFQNWHISLLRRQSGLQALPEDDLSSPAPPQADARWHEAFCQAARDWLSGLPDMELLILGLRTRYRLSQREVAGLVDMHEGTVSRRTDHLRDQCLDSIGRSLKDAGWTGDDLFDFVRTEMQSLLLDDARLSADNLAKLLAKHGKKLPKGA